MPELTDQIRSYIDDGIEEITFDEIRSRVGEPSVIPVGTSPIGQHDGWRRRGRLVLVGVVVVVVLAGVGALVAVGPRSRSGPVQPTGRVEAVFHIPPGPSRLIPLAEDVPVLTARLHALGDTGATVVVDGDSVVVEGGGPLPAPASFFVKYGHLTFRPVLCGAPAYTPSPTSPKSPSAASLPPCGAQYLLSVTNLGIAPSNGSTPGYTSNNISADPSFADYPSTTADDADVPSRTVLLTASPNSGIYPRLVVGPAQMDGSAIGSAQAQFDPNSSQWVVTYAFTGSKARLWDQTAKADFHRYLAIDLDGTVLSTPVIQPDQAVFSSFEGKGQISGNFTKTTARQLAALMLSGPLPAPLVPG